MYTVFVRLEIRPEHRAHFVEGIHRNARASLNDEAGCLRFDVHQDESDPNTFHLYEIYRDRIAFEVEHRAAAHYAQWRKVVDVCVIPGTQQNTTAVPLFPDDVPEEPATQEGPGR